jgi:Tol biopolymer transport system component
MRLPLPRALLATVVVLVAGAALVLRAGSSHAARAGVIVFASDRDKDEPGEIYSLARATAPRDVSRSLAGDYGLAVAPVGDQIAFWSDRSGSDQIYLARSDGSHLRRVRQAGGDLAVPNGTGNGGPLAFSADGTRLFTSGDAGSYLIDTRTAMGRALAFCETGVVVPSPDGRRVACTGSGRTIVYDLAGTVRFSFPGQFPIWSSRGWLTNKPGQAFAPPLPSAQVFDASGRKVGVVNGQPLDWSPNGRSLVFSRGQSLRISDAAALERSRTLVAKWGGGLSFTADSRFVAVADGKGRSLLVPLRGGPAIPGPAVRALAFGGGVWSRDGRLAYVDYLGQSPRSPGGKVSVYITDVHGRNPRVAGRFAYDARAASQLVWLPGGQRVLYVATNSCSGMGLFGIPATGGTARPLNADLRDLETPVWSPDGRRIAYSTQLYNCQAASTAPIHLETVGANGDGAHAVTDAANVEQGSFDLFPAFDPDGSQIAFLHSTSSSATLDTVPAAGGARSSVLPPGHRDAPAWSPDGSRIAFESGGSIWAVAATGGKAERLARIPHPYAGTCSVRGLAWSPDGKQFAAVSGDGIYLITLGKPASAKLVIRTPCAEWPSFSPDGTQIAFDARPANALGAQSAIMVANVDGSGLRTLTTVPFRQSVHPTWQPVP